jgi:hypothetical protein
MERSANANWSAGPTLWAFPCAKPSTSDNIPAIPLISYHNEGDEFSEPNEHDPTPWTYDAQAEFDYYSVGTKLQGMVWMEFVDNGQEADLIATTGEIGYAGEAYGDHIWWYGHSGIWNSCIGHRNNQKFQVHDSANEDLTLATTLNGSAETQIVVSETIATQMPNLICKAGETNYSCDKTVYPGGNDNLFVELDGGGEKKVKFKSWTGSTFTLDEGSGVDFSVDTATAGKNVRVECNPVTTAAGNISGSTFRDYGPPIPANWYDHCSGGKGYKWGSELGPPWTGAKIIFYQASELARVAAGEIGPFEVRPDTSLTIDMTDPVDYSWGNCLYVQAMAWDQASQMMYVAEAFESSEHYSVIHVFENTAGDPPEPPSDGADTKLDGAGVDGGGVGGN